jgi:hypothetical protein
LSSPAIEESMALDQRLDAIRKRRLSARISWATTLGVWFAVVAALVVAGGCGLLSSH